MDSGTIVAILTGTAGVTGGYFGGRKTGQANGSSIAAETMDMLQTQINLLKAKCDEIPSLLERISLLEELVLQRADVSAVKDIVTRIEGKLDGRP